MPNLTLDPTNLTAQFEHRGRGNPPSVLPLSAISNCFPGLEFDFRNVWRRVLEGIVLHEAVGVVMDVDPGVPANITELRGAFLVSVDGDPTIGDVQGPRTTGGAVESLGQDFLEWSNALARILTHAGEEVRCEFQTQQNTTITRMLKVRRFFHADELTNNRTAAIGKDLATPGELTQSLCSPWQNDYRECGCYYWAASRPDYVNVETTGGVTSGHNWMARDRSAAAPRAYTLNNSLLFTYDELFQNWETLLKFQIDGRDET